MPIETLPKEKYFGQNESHNGQYSFLVLVRHGESTWNAEKKWTGWTDVPLTSKGKEDARKSGSKLQDITIDNVISSPLQRAAQTLAIMCEELGIGDISPLVFNGLKERHYGIYTGKNKFEVEKEVGSVMFQQIRRGYKTVIPGGETGEEVHQRTKQTLDNELIPLLRAGENLLVASHGNTMRTLIMELEGLTPEQFEELEVGIGEVHIYLIDKKTGKPIAKTIRAENESRGKV